MMLWFTLGLSLLSLWLLLSLLENKMKKLLLIVGVTLMLSGCGKFSQMVDSSVSGFTTRCIEGTKFVILDSDRGVAITPLVGQDGLPKVCVSE
jgi:uncharacterized protein YceK